MHLKEVRILNYRSIEDARIQFQPRCRILVGINESGKTNILRALSFLDEKVLPTPEDLREFAPDEDYTQDAFVDFIFDLDKREQSSAYESFLSETVLDKPNSPILKLMNRELTLRQIFEQDTQLIYRVDIRGKKKYLTFWVNSSEKTLIRDIYKPKAGIAPTVQVKQKDESTRPLNKLKLLILDSSQIQGVESHLDVMQADDLVLAVRTALKAQMKDSLPDCIFWSYNESNLLPPEIECSEFADDPTICMPLKYMFNLAGINQIKEEIATAKERPNGMRNLLSRVSELSTRHIRKIWKDYRGISIELSENGSTIEAVIKDDFNRYNFARRSDGFKRFITFLLMISARERTEQLQDVLYLHDEPDASLHPSGARHLRDELIKISKRNYVVYSTHSIFMIDRDKVERHLIVKKEKERTKVSEANESNIVDEEVIYNALGYSIFENLKKRNIIFEGWRDKRLFAISRECETMGKKSDLSILKDVGICHAKGVKDISRITSLLELAGRECWIITDSDDVAKEGKRKYTGYGEWQCYDDLVGNLGIKTAEDFIKDAYFLKCLKKAQAGSGIEDLKTLDLKYSIPRIDSLKRALAVLGIDSEAMKTFLELLKTEIFEHLKPSNVDPSYTILIEKLCEHFTMTKSDDQSSHMINKQQRT